LLALSAPAADGSEEPTMRRSCVAFAMVCLLVPAWAHAQSGTRTRGSAVGFGGMTLDASSTAPSVGGTLTVALTPNVHIVGEAGRLGNVLPSLSDSLFAVAGVRASAIYGEGGVRFVATPRAVVSPYAEATAGVARIGVSSDRFGTIGNVILPAAFSFVSRTGPVAGVGGGVVVHAGPMQLDVGYRYKQLYPPTAVEVALGLGQQLRSHQLRAGVGVSF
jgi:hypothetical protein